MDASKLKKIRIGHKGAITRLLTKLEDFTDSQDTTQIGTILKTLIEKRETISKLNEKILQECEEDDLIEEVTESDEYTFNLDCKIAHIKTLLHGSNTQLNANAQDFVPENSHSDVRVYSNQPKSSSSSTSNFHKLPKLSLPSFNGDILTWQSFWDSFETSIHSNDSLTDVQKFSYLKSLLENDSANVIAGLTITNANYETAIYLLRERYGQKHKIVHAYMKSLLDLRPPSTNLADLRIFHDNSEAYIRGLESLGQTQDMFGALLIPVLLDKLPPGIRMSITRQNGSDEWSLDALRQSIKRELNILEAGIGTRESIGFTANFHTGNKSKSTVFVKNNTSSALSRTYTKQCSFCDSEHLRSECPLSIDEKYEAVKRKNLCFNCLGNHKISNCASKYNCKHCNKRHNTYLCRENNSENNNALCVASEIEPKENSENVAENVSGQSTALYSMMRNRSVLLKTAVGTVTYGNHECETNILFDEGAQKSYITQELAQKLELVITGSETLTIASFGGKETSRTLKTATICLRGNAGEKIPINVVIVPTIATPIKVDRQCVTRLPYLRNITLAHPYSENVSFEISLLIGADHYWNVVGNHIIRGPGPTAVSSKIGYLLSGPSASYTSNSKITSSAVYNILTYHKQEEVDLERFWNVEDLKVQQNSAKDDATPVPADELISFERGRYVAKLPWKKEMPTLPSNVNIARNRTQHTIRRLLRDPALLKMYGKIICEQEKLGFIEKIDGKNSSNERVHYIPHHPVSKDSATTPIRVVYDCSCRANRYSPSLNDCLESTPPQLNNLTAVLTRFRANKYAMTADIEKAFLQIGLDECDRDATRFFWLSDVNDANSPLTEYRFKVVLFGATCSPYLLDAALRKHFAVNQSQITEELLKTLYVDNVLSSFADEQTLLNFYENSREILKKGGFKLRAWNSNNENLRNRAKADSVLDTDEFVKILGMRWNFESDNILFQKQSFKTEDTLVITKREVLSRSSKIFDPLGLLSPVTVSAKILMQDVWKENLTWDEPLPKMFQTRWNNLAKELEQSTSIEIQRYLKLGSTDQKSTLHIFSDASLRVYGANAYLVTGNTSNLVMAKNRLAPLQTTTLPRMELMGAVMGADLANHLISILDIKSVVFWCDSQIVLHWLMSDKQRGKFIMNQKTKIGKLCENMECTWRYVPTNDNPADLQTRGITTKELRDSSLWRQGPIWITDSSKWPDWKITALSDDDDHTESKEISSFVAHTSATPGISNIMEISRYGSLGKLLRVTVYVLRFLDNCRKTRIHRLRQRVTNMMSLETIQPLEITKAKMLWIKNVQKKEFFLEMSQLAQKKRNSTLIKQLKLYLDEDVIRCKGRIDYSSVTESAKNPILLPKKHLFTEMVVKDTHKNILHAGCSQTVTALRQTYWIPSVRQCVNHVLKYCVVCQKVTKKHYELPDTSQLPRDRVEECVPFYVTGIDYAGPLHVKENGGTNKVYICLFTCATSRAVHLELVTDLSTKSFVLAFRRFVSFNGSPSTIYSDNATTFVAAEKEMFAKTGISLRWKFIPKGAPWHGGFWERLIGLTKVTLKRVLGKALVNTDSLRTLLTEISSVLNDRPLTYVSSNFSDIQALTPSHLVRGRRRNIPHLYEDERNFPVQLDVVSVNKHYERKQEILQHFMGRWKTEYLTRLREYHLGHGKNAVTINVGDIVQIEDNKPRVNWKLGVITELCKGNDGHVRSVNLRTSNGFITSRPITKLYPLEL